MNLVGQLRGKTAMALVMATVAIGSPQAARAQGAPAVAQLQAKVDALQDQLRQMQAEIAELRRQGSTATFSQHPATPSTAVAAQSSTGAPSTGTPTTGATAGVATGIPGTAVANAAPPSGPAPRIFGPSIPTSAAVSRIDAGHPVIATADGRFTASLIGIMQFDVGDYFQKAPGPLNVDFRRAGSAADNLRAGNLSDGSTFRRARIGIAGKAFGDFEYSILFDFGGSGVEDNGHVQELWLQYSGWKPAHFRVGAFAPFIGLEDAGATNGMMFLERPTSAEVARGLAGGDFREAGQVAFTGGRWFASAALSGRLVNTAGSSAVQPYQSQLGFIGRAGLLPIKTKDAIVHLGVHGSYVDHPSNTAGPNPATGAVVTPIQLRDRPELRVDGTRLIDTGPIDTRHAYTAGLEAAAQYRNFLIQGEYEHYGIERRASILPNPRFHGYYVEGSWVITGQRRRYNDGNYAFDGPAVAGSFNPAKGDWGAWELALRWSDTDLNYRQGRLGFAPPTGAVRGGEQKIFTAGVNWYLNSVARVMFDYQHVNLARLSPNATTYLTPVGAEVGQTYSAAAMRFQLAF